jgi:hypothetical protein
MTHLPASPSSKQLGKAARVFCAYKRGPNLISRISAWGKRRAVPILKGCSPDPWYWALHSRIQDGRKQEDY